MTQDDVKKNVLPALFMVCKEILGKLEKAEEKTENLEAENASLKLRVAELEFANCKNSVKIDGLKLHRKNKDGKESSVQSKEIVQKLIKDLAVLSTLNQVHTPCNRCLLSANDLLQEELQSGLMAYSLLTSKEAADQI